MIKRASTILLTLFLLLLGINTAFATPSCQTTFSKTNFAPKTTGATYYDLDEITFSEGIYTDISCPLDYVENANPGRGKYTVSGNKLSIGCVKEGNLLAINIPNLKPGKVYSISITGNVRLRAKEGDASEKHRTKFKLAVGNSNKYFENNKSDWSATGPCNMSLEFTASSDYVAATISTDYSGDCYILDISEIKIIGCFDPTITSSNGNEICKGEENTYTAIGINGPLKWEYSTDNKATWKKLTDKTGNSVTADLQDEFFYVRASNGTNKVESNKIQTFICCSKTSTNKDKHIVVYEEYFNLKNGQRRQLDNNARSQYPYSSSGPIGGDRSISKEKAEYAIVHKASDGEYWTSEPVRTGNTKKNDPNDGFLLVNCGKEKQDFFYYIVKQGNLCSESLYDFSVDITNVDNTPGQAPVNASILVYGQKNGVLSSTPLLEIETGNLESGHDWETFTRSFNSGQYNEFRISVRNNYQGTESDVKGNDIGLDNIVFRTCAPEIQIFSPKEDGTLEYEEVLLECNKTITLEAIATYDLTEFFSTPQYLFQISKDKVNWTNVGSVQTTPSVEITVDDTYLNGFYYQVWVGADAAEVLESGRTQTQGTGCGALTAVSEPISVKYECTDSSLPPTLKDFSSCALEDGKYDLYNTITKINLSDGTSEDVSNLDLAAKKAKIATLGKIEWFKEGETTALASSVIDFPTSPNTPGKYIAKFTQVDASTVYTQSGPASVKISLKETIVATVDKDNIADCKSRITEDDRTITATLTSGALADAVYTWSELNEDGTVGNVLQQSSSAKYTIPLPAESSYGKIQLVVSSKSDAACESEPITIKYNISAVPTIEVVSITVPCQDQILSNGVVIKLNNMKNGNKCLGWSRWIGTYDNYELGANFTSYDQVSTLPGREPEYFKVIDYQDEEEFTFYDTYFTPEYTEGYTVDQITTVRYMIWIGDDSGCIGVPSNDYEGGNVGTEIAIKDVNSFSFTQSGATFIKKEGEEDEEGEYHICEGGSVTVKAGYELIAGEHFEWKVNGETPADADADSQSYTISEIKETTTFTATIIADPGVETCGGSAEITIYVDKKPEIAVRDTSLCYGESVVIKVTGEGDKYAWTPALYLSNAEIKTPKITPEVTTKYSLDVTKGVCTVTVEDIDVVVNPLPEIGNITVDTDQEGRNTLKVEIDDVNAYSYSLDGITYGDKGVLPTTLPIGYNQLYVVDENGCKSSKLFEVEPTPIYPEKYFTPNGDGVNETWNVENLNMYPAYIVEIFDRYSKRLFVQRVGSFNTGGNTVDGDEFTGWDGMYNGHPMPSDDYWYLITVEEIRKQYTGHFTLKR